MLFQYLAVIVCAWSVVSAAPKKSCGISFISRKRCGTGTEDKSACEAMNCCFDTGAMSTSTMRCYRSGNTLSLGHPTKKPQIWRNRQQTPRDQTLNLYSLLGNNQIDRNLAIASWISNLDTSGTGYGHLALSSVLGDSYINRLLKLYIKDNLAGYGINRRYIGGYLFKPKRKYTKMCDATKSWNRCGNNATKYSCRRWNCCWNDVTKICFHATINSLN